MAKFSTKEDIEAAVHDLSGNLPDYTINGNDLSADDPAAMLRLFLTSIFGKTGLTVSELRVETLDLKNPPPGRPAKEFGTINLRGITTKSSLTFANCEIGTLQLSDAALRSVYVISSRIGRVEAPRLKLSGSLDLSEAQGKVHFLELSGAEIGGNLDLSKLEISGDPMPDFPEDQHKKLALRADGVSIRGNLFMREVIAHGEVRLNGCNVGRNIDIFRGELRHSGGFALSIAGGDVKGNLGFGLGPERESNRERATVQGTLRLSASKIRGRLDFSRVDLFKEPGGHYTAECQGVEVGGSLSTASFSADGAINLSDATIHGGWTGEDIKFKTPNNPSIVANGIRLNGLLDFVGLDTDGFLSFRRGEFRGGFRLNDAHFKPDKRAAAGRALARGSGDHDTFQHSIENWRYVECGLILDRAIVLGSFELGACVQRGELSPCIPPRSDRTDKGQERERDRVIELQKDSWNGTYAWLCFDATAIPEIDRTAYLSFKEFEFIDLSNCTYKSVITREESVRVDRETHDRIRAKRWAPAQNASMWQFKRQKILDFWNAGLDAVKAANPQLDAPDVDGWLRLLDAAYAPLAYRSGHRLPRWAQRYSKLRLLFAFLINGLLFMGWQAQFLSSLLLFLIVFAIFDPVDRQYPDLLLQCLAVFCLAVAIGGWFWLKIKKSKHISALVRDEIGGHDYTESRMRAERKTASDRIRNHLLRHDYGLKLPVFHPQPYLQLARTMRDDGFDKHAADVIVAMEWRRAWYGDFAPGQQFLQWIKGMFLGFGFNRLRPLALQLGLVLVSTFIFQYGYETGAIVPSKLNEITPPNCIHGAPTPTTGDEAANPAYADKLAYVRFNGVLYAAETVLPLTDFGQKKNWIVEPVAGFEPRGSDSPFPLLNNHDDFWEALSFHLIAVYSVLVTALGYLLSVLFVAGLSGVITPKY
jgi:hypothetical protein